MVQPFRAKKSLGQNFLTNAAIAESIARAATLNSGDVVLEIGPGTGMLTRELLKEGVRVVAVEADERAIEVLSETFHDEIARKNLTILHADIRTAEIADLPLPTIYSVVANIPYYLSGFLFEKLLSGTHQPKKLVFLVQKEVAERIARSKKESLLSLSIKAYGTPRYVATVSKGNFVPQPKVDSAILAIQDISKEKFTKVSEEQFFRVLKAGFQARRKLLMGNLTAIAPRPRLESIFEDLALPKNLRGEDLSIDRWLALASRLG